MQMLMKSTLTAALGAVTLMGAAPAVQAFPASGSAITAPATTPSIDQVYYRCGYYRCHYRRYGYYRPYYRPYYRSYGYGYYGYRPRLFGVF